MNPNIAQGIQRKRCAINSKSRDRLLLFWLWGLGASKHKRGCEVGFHVISQNMRCSCVGKIARGHSSPINCPQSHVDF